MIDHFAVGLLPQHVVAGLQPAEALRHQRRGQQPHADRPAHGQAPGRPIPVDDPYNLYFTPDGRFAIVVAERLRRLDFRNAHTFGLHHSLPVPCVGIDHLDFTADGRFLVASCEFSGQVVVVDVARERVVRTIDLPTGAAPCRRTSSSHPDGRSSTWPTCTPTASGRSTRAASAARLPADRARGAHGLYPSRDAKLLYVTNRGEGTISVIRFVRARSSPTGASPAAAPTWAAFRPMAGCSGSRAVTTPRCTRSRPQRASARRIPVGAGPHGLCVWPQPGRYSLGHTGIMR